MGARASHSHCDVVSEGGGANSNTRPKYSTWTKSLGPMLIIMAKLSSTQSSEASLRINPNFYRVKIHLKMN